MSEGNLHVTRETRQATEAMEVVTDATMRGDQLELTRQTMQPGEPIEVVTDVDYRPTLPRTSQMTASSAQICRDLEWTPGTRIAAPATSRAMDTEAIITAIGDRGVLARLVRVEGIELDDPFEALLDLHSRDWIFLAPAP